MYFRFAETAGTEKQFGRSTCDTGARRKRLALWVRCSSQGQEKGLLYLESLFNVLNAPLVGLPQKEL